MAKKKAAETVYNDTEQQTQNNEQPGQSAENQQKESAIDNEVVKPPVSESSAEAAEPVKLSDRELIEQNPEALVQSIQGPNYWQDKDFINLEGVWRWIPNAHAWDFVRQHNTAANGPKKYVSITDLQPLGREISI